MRHALAWLLVLAIGTTAVPALLAQDDGSGEDEQRKELQRIEEQRRETLRKADELKKRESSEMEQLKSLEQRERRERNRIAQLNKRQRALKGDLQTVERELGDAESAYELRRRQLALRLRELYKMGRLREIEYLVESETVADFFVRLEYVERLAERDYFLMRAIDNEKTRIVSAQEKLDNTLTQVERNTREKQKKQKELQGLQSKKKQLVASIQGEREKYEAAAEELRRTASRIRRLLADLERQRTGADILPPYEGNFSAGRQKLPWPVNGQVIGTYGNEKHPKWGTVTFNSGIDIAAPIGTDIRAVARGRVDFVSSSYGSYGQMVILNHGEGYYTLYAHCSAILAARGDEVEAGQVIARVGDTGSLKGSILHFEVRKGKAAIDPEEWLR